MTTSHDRSEETALCEAACRAIAWDRARFVFTHPYLATLALHLVVVPVIDERLPTAAPDGASIFVNPYWLAGLDPADRAFVLAHEVWHVAFLHFDRGRDADPRRWNIAADHEVNDRLRRAGLTVPEGAVWFADWSGAAAEDVYARLSPSALPDEAWLDGDVHLPAVGDDARGADVSGRFGPIAGRRDPAFATHPRPDAGEVWRDRLVIHRDKLAGLLPLAVQAIVDAVSKPEVDWRELLRDLVVSASGGRFRWLPPSRRHVHRGLYLPSRREGILRLAVAVDTSGSTYDDWPLFHGAIKGVLAAFGRYEVRLLCCDADVHSDEVYDEATPLPSRLPFIGGGGTDFRPVFARLADDPPAALVFLTDGLGIAPGEPPPYPVLFCLTADGEAPVSWGRVVRLVRGREPCA